MHLWGETASWLGTYVGNKRNCSSRLASRPHYRVLALHHFTMEAAAILVRSVHGHNHFVHQVFYAVAML